MNIKWGKISNMLNIVLEMVVMGFFPGDIFIKHLFS